MSEVKVDKLSPRTGTTVTLGDASDVFQLPASAEIDIASGATLDVNGIIDLTGATKTGFPSAGFADVHVDVSNGSETYTVPSIAAGDPADITKLLVFITGGGGGGASGAASNGTGGGAGGTVMARVTVVAADTITILIGAGGGAGVIGGDSTFTHASGSGSGSMSTITASGGIAGVHSALIGAPAAPTVGASNEGIAIRGGWPNGPMATGGIGGASFWGGGAEGCSATNWPAQIPYAFGSGGGGGSYSATAGSNVGSAGADGVCFIMEFK